MTPLGERRVAAERAAAATAGWWVVLVAGVLTILAGILVLRIHWTVSGLAIFLGAVFIVRGLASMISPTFDEGARGLKVVTGLLEAGVGVGLIAWPGPGLTVIATFFGVWLVFGALVEIAGAVANRDQSMWWLVLILGILQMILGVWALNRPGATLQLLIALAGIWAVIAGTLEVVFAFDLRRTHKLAREVEETRAGRIPASAAL